MNAVVQPFLPEFQLCAELFAVAEWKEPLPNLREADSIIYSLAARATKSFRGVLHLCLLGHGEQALMIVRSLIEDTVTAHLD